MASPRPPKKSESLEIRLPFDTKQAFMARCRDEGVTASEAVPWRTVPFHTARLRSRWIASACSGIARSSAEKARPPDITEASRAGSGMSSGSSSWMSKA